MDMVILCPYSLHILSSSCQLRFMRLFDVEAKLLCTYEIARSNMYNMLVAHENGVLDVYEDVSLV